MIRDPEQVHNHRMMSEELLRERGHALAQRRRSAQGRLWSTSMSPMTRPGHHVPTDSPLRHVMLVVEATDADGKPLPLQRGPTLPAWTGDYAGQPGALYAKILQDEWTGECQPAPSGDRCRLPRIRDWRPWRLTTATMYLTPQSTATSPSGAPALSQSVSAADGVEGLGRS